jgi:hypothetical protein
MDRALAPLVMSPPPRAKCSTLAGHTLESVAPPADKRTAVAVQQAAKTHTPRSSGR